VIVKVKETRLTWLGQAGFLLEAHGRRLLIDPWISPDEARLLAPAPFELVCEGIDWVLVTHEHDDHLDLPFLRRLARRSPDARLIVPAPIASRAQDILELAPVGVGERLELGELSVSVMPAWHCVDVADGYGDGDGRFVGYVISGAGATIYHAGDTVPDPALLDALGEQAVELALLPINGRDAEREARNIAGNLDAREAVELARAIGARTLVPYHWDAVAGNTARPGAAADAAAAAPGGGPHVLVLAQLQPYRLC
jgi:L-ascorbate metabolism protein UlaG (beta-lactamase superfamily)